MGVGEIKRDGRIDQAGFAVFAAHELRRGNAVLFQNAFRERAALDLFGRVIDNHTGSIA